MANGLQLFHIHTKHFQFLPGKRLYLPDSVCQLNQEKRFQEGFLWAASRRCALAPQARELASLQVEQESELAAQSAERTEGRGWVRSPLPRSCPTGSSVCAGEGRTPSVTGGHLRLVLATKAKPLRHTVGFPAPLFYINHCRRTGENTHSALGDTVLVLGASCL